MKKFTITFWCAILLLPILVSCDDSSEEEAASKMSLKKQQKEVEKYLKEIDSSYKEMQLDHQKHIWSEGEDRKPEQGLVTLLREIILSEEVANKIKKFDYNNFKDKNIKRQAELMVKAGSYTSNDEDDLIEIFTSLINMLNLGKTPKNCFFEGGNENCTLQYFPEVVNRIIETSDEKELRFYWQQFGEKFGKKGRNLVSTYTDLYARGAVISGYEKPSAMYYAEFDNDWLLSDFEKTVEIIKPLYTELHSFVRYKLHERYGPEIVSVNGTIPQHLVQKLILEAFNTDAVVDYPEQEKALPNMTAALILSDFKEGDIFKKANEFYTSLGFDDLPSDFYEDNLRKKDDNSSVCYGEIYMLETAAGYKYCPRIDFRNYLNTHKDLASIHYDLLYREQPAAYWQEAAPGFGKAIGHSVALSAISSTHLKNQFGEKLQKNDFSTINGLYRLALYYVFSIYQRYIEEKLWIDILDGKVGAYDYNCHYWKLQNDIAGVSPPVPRSEDDFDISPNFYSKIDNSMNTQFLLSEIIGFDLYSTLCKISGQYSKEKPLHRCSFYNEKIIGYILKPLMSDGRKESWHQVLQTLNISIDDLGTGILEYFGPLYEWLQTKNRENCRLNGWEDSNMCQKG